MPFPYPLDRFLIYLSIPIRLICEKSHPKSCLYIANSAKSVDILSTIQMKKEHFGYATNVKTILMPMM